MKLNPLEKPRIEIKKKEEKFETVFDTPEKVERLKYRIYDLVDKVRQEKIKCLIFLDRSARPLSWAFRAAWNHEKLKMKRPEILFLNFGQEKQQLVDYAGGRESLDWLLHLKQSEFENELMKLKKSGKKQKLAKRIKEIEEFGEVKDFPLQEDHPFVLKFSEFGKELLLEEEFYRKFFNQEIVNKWSKNFEKINGKILFVDDYSHSGGTRETLKNMFEYNFPKIDFNFDSIFKKGDSSVFPIPKGALTLDPKEQVILPWTLKKDKALTMMADESKEDRSSLTAKPEKDYEKRARALALKNEIKEIFSQ